MSDQEGPRTGSPTDPRTRLLDAVIAYAGEHGLADTSLRQLAEGVGTSHRMLIHHFGSKDQLLVAVVREVERRQRDALADLATRSVDGDGEAIDPADLGWTFWERLADPALAPLERLFFELYAQALLDRPWAADFLDGIVEDWIGPVAVMLGTGGLDPTTARARARLSVAVSRGLLLDLLATGDRTGVDAAMADFAAMLAAVAPSGATATPSS